MSVGQCPICLEVKSVTREHVWPDWFLRRMDKEQPPPFGWSLNGTPLLARSGDQIKGTRRQRVMIPVCDSCNAAMNTLIEVPAKPVIGPLVLNGWRGGYSREQWRTVGLWWAKVLLLIGHPDSFLENPRLQKQVELDFESKPDVRWLADGSGIPMHVSVFVNNTNYSSTGSEHDLTVPAHVLFDDKASADCPVLSIATTGMAVAVVSHPGTTIEHPLVQSDHAWELLHSPPRRGDLGELRSLSRDNVRYLRGGSVPEGHVIDASETSRLAALFEYEVDPPPPQ